MIKTTKNRVSKKKINAKVGSDFVLPASLDISSAADLFGEMKKLSFKKCNLTLDGENVTRLTTPCVQILLSAAKTVGENKKSFLMKNPSEAIQEVFCDLGLEEYLNKWSDAK